MKAYLTDNGFFIAVGLAMLAAWIYGLATTDPWPSAAEYARMCEMDGMYCECVDNQDYCIERDYEYNYGKGTHSEDFRYDYTPIDRFRAP